MNNEVEITRSLAKKVMGWEPILNSPNGAPPSSFWDETINGERYVNDWSDDAWRPLTDEKHAAMVLDRMEELGWHWLLTSETDHKSKDRFYTCYFDKYDKLGIVTSATYGDKIKLRAICFAALGARLQQAIETEGEING